MLRRVIAAAALALLLAACGETTAPPVPGPANYSGKVLHLGAILSLSGAGSALGIEQQNAISLAVEQLNANGGVSGAKVAVDIQDDASDPQQGLQVLQALVRDRKVVGIIGPTLANTALTTDPEAQRLKTPVILPSSFGATIPGACAKPCDYLFRDSLSQAASIPVNVKEAATRLHPRTAAILYAADDRTSAEGAVLFQQAFTDNGITVAPAAVQSFAKAETSLQPFVAAALGRRADVWAVSAQGQVPAAIVREARTEGFTGPILGGGGFTADGLAAQLGASGKSVQFASAYFAGLGTPANTAFLTAYRAKFKDPAGVAKTPGELAAQAYSAVLLFAAAAPEAALTFRNPVADRSALRDALARVSASTPLGSVEFTSTHDVRQPIYTLEVDGKGGYTLLSTLPPR